MSWQKILAQGFTSANQLLNFLELPYSESNSSVEKQFPSRIPLGFAKRMEKGNRRDPLLLQVLANEVELKIEEGYAFDPLNELKANPLKGLIHKYYGRVLITVVGSCAVNCRYCFRRHFPYQDNNPGRSGWQAICEYIHQDTSITEVIFSGGDPLLATDKVLSELIQKIEAIPHVHTVRIHTRIPVVLPERIDRGLLEVLAGTRLKKVVVLHCNHPNELDKQVHERCLALQKIGCHVLNQSVLLAGVNDEAQVLANLSQILFSFGVLPYYLHTLDKVGGVAHFDLAFDKVQKIYKKLQELLPGYLVPRLVREEPGKPSKTQL